MRDLFTSSLVATQDYAGRRGRVTTAFEGSFEGTDLENSEKTRAHKFGESEVNHLNFCTVSTPRGCLFIPSVNMQSTAVGHTGKKYLMSLMRARVSWPRSWRFEVTVFSGVWWFWGRGQHEVGLPCFHTGVENPSI